MAMKMFRQSVAAAWDHRKVIMLVLLPCLDRYRVMQNGSSIDQRRRRQGRVLDNLQFEDLPHRLREAPNQMYLWMMETQINQRRHSGGPKLHLPKHQENES